MTGVTLCLFWAGVLHPASERWSVGHGGLDQTAAYLRAPQTIRGIPDTPDIPDASDIADTPDTWKNVAVRSCPQLHAMKAAWAQLWPESDLNVFPCMVPKTLRRPPPQQGCGHLTQQRPATQPRAPDRSMGNPTGGDHISSEFDPSSSPQNCMYSEMTSSGSPRIMSSPWCSQMQSSQSSRTLSMPWLTKNMACDC